MTYTGRIAVARRFGSPEVIELENHPSPELRSGQIRVAVRVSGLNPIDARLRSGNFGGGVPMALGTEFSGTVIESRAHNIAVGDDVIGWGVQGANADLVVTDTDRVTRKPVSIDWAVAAGIGGVGTTALTSLDALQLKSGDLIVVHGAAGGVGTVLIQLARARGLEVIGSASESNQEYLASLGALPVIYGSGLADHINAAAGSHTVAASIDLAGSREAGDFAVNLQAAGGQAITLVPETAQSHGIQLVRTQRTAGKMRELLESLESGRLTIQTSTLPLTEIVEAHRRLDAAHAQGKLVIDVSDNPHLPTA